MICALPAALAPRSRAVERGLRRARHGRAVAEEIGALNGAPSAPTRDGDSPVAGVDERHGARLRAGSGKTARATAAASCGGLSRHARRVLRRGSGKSRGAPSLPGAPQRGLRRVGRRTSGRSDHHQRGGERGLRASGWHRGTLDWIDPTAADWPRDRPRRALVVFATVAAGAWRFAFAGGRARAASPAC